MKKIVLAIVLTSAAWLSAAYAAYATESVYVLSASQMRGLESQFTEIYNAGYAAYKELQRCQGV